MARYLCTLYLDASKRVLSDLSTSTPRPTMRSLQGRAKTRPGPCSPALKDSLKESSSLYVFNTYSVPRYKYILLGEPPAQVNKPTDTHHKMAEPPIPLPDDANPADIKSQVLQLTLTSIQSSDSDENPCVICLETITSPSTALPCGHSNYDFLCLASWLQQRPFCPLCKTGVTQVRYTDADTQNEHLYNVPPLAPTPEQPARQTVSRAANPADVLQLGPLDFERYLFGDVTSIQVPPVRRNLRRRQSNHQPPPPPSTPDQALQRRQHIYRHNLFSLRPHPRPVCIPSGTNTPPLDIGSSPHTSYSPSVPSPAVLSSTPHLLSKARLFLRRELQVFFPPTAAAPSAGDSIHQNREFLLEYVIAMLKTVDLQSPSGAAHAENLLRDYITLPDTGDDRTALFLHELKNWMRWRGEPPGNVSLEGWDRGVQYPSLDEGRKRRYDGGEEDDEEREGRGYSWQDKAGDHWRPDPPHCGQHSGRNDSGRRRGGVVGNGREDERSRRRRHDV
uniref:RING-type E3 ubiquitin transferase n=2 Tax=Podospora anserina (strain S / ATCC MYA-4624 / DSM 980 / FGSC 10383) TaxID=515849 RepID=A0A090CMX3_PODAN|nr:Putative protein of unknown function [Podospora anserina S mat+]